MTTLKPYKLNGAYKIVPSSYEMPLSFYLVYNACYYRTLTRKCRSCKVEGANHSYLFFDACRNVPSWYDWDCKSPNHRRRCLFYMTSMFYTVDVGISYSKWGSSRSWKSKALNFYISLRPVDSMLSEYPLLKLKHLDLFGFEGHSCPRHNVVWGWKYPSDVHVRFCCYGQHFKHWKIMISLNTLL